jgi:hypothetical protein
MKYQYVVTKYGHKDDTIQPEDVNLGTNFADFYSFQLNNLCSHVDFAIIAVKLMRIDTTCSRAVMEQPCGSDMYQLDANCLVKKPKYVAMPGVCPIILKTHCLGNRGQHLF